jgi:hypothetical protein
LYKNGQRTKETTENAAEIYLKKKKTEWHGGDEVVPGKRRNEGDGDNDPLGVFSLSF